MSNRSEHVLLFVSARWCHIADPMRVIFEELLRDLAKNHPELQVRGLEIDIDEAEAIMAGILEDSAAGRNSREAWDHQMRDTGDRPSARDATRVVEPSKAPGWDRIQLLDPAVTRELLESVDFVPMLIVLRDGGEIARFTGQLPKLRIRSGLLDALDRPARDAVDQAGGDTADQPDANAVDRAGGDAADLKNAAE
ncbi:MAG: hypothetical protein Q3979_03095 [Actinomycetaceae bacterium]|nr:hypothetical protein [Actinomycetaceae bacterium]